MSCLPCSGEPGVDEHFIFIAMQNSCGRWNLKKEEEERRKKTQSGATTGLQGTCERTHRLERVYYFVEDASL